MSEMKKDAEDAAYRLAGKQFVKLTREPIIAFLAGHLGPDDPSVRARIATFLDSELGGAMVSMILSLGISALPGGLLQEESKQKMARELRVRSMASTGDVMADLLMGPLRAVISNMILGEEKESLSLPSPEGTTAPKETLADLHIVPSEQEQKA